MSPHAGTEPVHKWYVMAAVAVGIFLATIDASIVNIALPVLERDLHTDFAVVEWVVLAYMVTIVTVMLSIGRLADMIGQKPIYAVGMVVFTASSVLCGCAASIAMLISFRVLQAVGAAMTMAVSSAIITAAFPASERGKALGIGGLFVSVGIIAGPTLGGIILGVLSWHWIFFVNLPLGILGTILTLRFVPADRPTGGQTFDVPGAACLFLALLALTIGQTRGFSAAPVLALFGGFQSPNNSAIMGAVPRERLGVASGLLSLTRTLGQTVGIAVVGALWSTRVFAHAEAATWPAAGAAPAHIQVMALNQTLRVIVGVVLIALALSLWALWQERRLRAADRMALRP